MTTETASDLTFLLSQSVIHPIPLSQVEIHLSNPPFISLPGAINLRTLTAPTIAPDHIYRCGVLTHVPAPTLSLLRTTYGIRTVYDLRSASEREKYPSPAIEGAETVWIPNTADGTIYIKDENGELKKKEKPTEVPTAMFAEGDGSEAWARNYGNILDMHGHIYKAVFERFRDGEEGAILFHCTGWCSHKPINS
jgi:protein tyrosine/serine phosphatase